MRAAAVLRTIGFTLAFAGAAFASACGGSSSSEAGDGGSSQGGAACVSDGVEYPSGSLVRIDCNSCACIDGTLRNCTHQSCPNPPLRCTHSSQCPVNQACITPTCNGTGVCVHATSCPTDGDTVCDCL